MRNFTQYLFYLFLFLFSIQNSYAVDRKGRLGIGMSNQLKNSIPAVSFKVQRTQSFSLGGQIGYSSSETDGGHGAALKVYRNFFEEPLLVFYGSILAGIVEKKIGTVEESGFQFDFTLGSEFSFNGLQSIGFSFEFGLSMNKLDGFVAETVGNSFVVSAVHFYL